MNCTCDMDGRGKACHCRRCCLTFSSLSAFDSHVVRGEHVPPRTRGLAEVRPGVWGKPSTDDRRLHLSTLRTEQDQPPMPVRV